VNIFIDFVVTLSEIFLEKSYGQKGCCPSLPGHGGPLGGVRFFLEYEL